MKKLITLIFIFILSLSLISCTNNQGQTPDGDNNPPVETPIVDQEKVNAVKTLIENLPSLTEVTLEDEEAIINARNEVKKLNNDEVKLITNISKLTSLETKINRLKEKYEEDIIEEIEALIDNLPSIVSLKISDKYLIENIEELISKLRETSVNKISNIMTFELAKSFIADLEYEELINSTSKVVIDLIDMLPSVEDVTLDDFDKVNAVRAEYDKLLDGAKSLVSNYIKLSEIEYVLNTLKEFQNFDPRDVLNCISDVATSDTNDLIITEGENFTVEWESSNEKLFYFEEGYAKVSKVHQTHRKQNVTVTANITLANGEVINLTKQITVNPVLFKDLPSTPVATYFQSSALSNYTKYSERYLSEGTLFSEKAKETLDIIYYAFANLDEAGNIKLANYDVVDALMELKANDVRVILCVAGVSSTASMYFTEVTKDDAKRARFVKNIMDAVETYNFDGVDIDWESTSSYPVVAVSMNKLMRDLRNEMKVRQDPNGSPYLLSAAIPSTSWGTASDRFDFATLNKYVDYINMMSYDLNNTSKATHLSPLHKSSYDGGYGFSVEYGVEIFTSRGLDKNKIIIGSAGYGKSYTVSGTIFSGNNPALGANASLTYLNGIPGAHASGTLFYNAIDRLLKGTQYKKYIEYNTKGQIVGSYLFNEYAKIFVTYESEEIIAAKYQYALETDGMGIMCWAYTEDTSDNFVDTIYDEIQKAK